jgi:mRNA interferase HigB
MHVIAKKALEDFWKIHPIAKSPLESWYRIVSRSNFESFSDVREAFRSADHADSYTIFDIGGNSFRIIAVIHYNRQKVYIRQVFTHSEYDRWCKQKRSKGK